FPMSTPSPFQAMRPPGRGFSHEEHPCANSELALAACAVPAPSVLAIVGSLAVATVGALGAASSSTVDVSLSAILGGVRATWCLAHFGLANLARAVRRREASLPGWAG